MNGKDFDDMCKSNREYYAKEQARLEHIYETEKAKYSVPAPITVSTSPVKTTSSTCHFYGGYGNNNNSIEARLERLEDRIDKLYEMFGNQPKYSSDGMFIIAPESAKIKAKQSITLTDSQFEMLLKKLFDD